MIFKFESKLDHQNEIDIKNETEELFLNIFGFDK